VVDYPLSDYVQWEIVVYKAKNVPLGKEQVYLVDRKDIANLALPAGDLMMFDQKDAVIGNYDETGYAITQSFYNQSDSELKGFLQLREALVSAPLQAIKSNQ
jgi:hypothetical protein